MGCTSAKSEKPDKQNTQQNAQQNQKNVIDKQEKNAQNKASPKQEQKSEKDLNNDSQLKIQKIHNNPSAFFATETPGFQKDIGDISKKNTASVENIRQFYKVGKVLGSGSFGTVRICSSRYEISRKYAIKTIAKERMGKKVYMLRRELEILKTLDHPNIIKFYEIYMDDMYIHFVMEYCNGGDLYNHVIQNGCFNEKEGSKLIQKLISAGYHMHQRKVIHRDLKPENILFINEEKSKNNEGSDLTEIKIIDFGLSRIFKPENSTQIPTVVGTPLYVAPEIVEEKNYFIECDCWSIGVVTYFILSGKEPFYAKSIGEVYEKIRSGQYNFPADQWDKISSQCKDFISKLLVVDPKKRMTCEEALQHPWFKLFSNDQGPIKLDYKLKQNVQNILTGQTQHVSKLKDEAIKVLINHHISSKELLQLQQSFKQLDKDKNGELSLEEMLEVMIQLGLKDQQEQMKQIFKQRGGQEKLVLNYSEFIQASMNLNEHLNKEKLWSLFRYFDFKELGYFQLKDIKDAIAREGRKLQDTELENMFKEVDLQKDDKIDFELFQKIMGGENLNEERIEKISSSLVNIQK